MAIDLVELFTADEQPTMANFNEKITGFNEAMTALALADMKIQMGSYVGTGTYGADNPCSITFDFEPVLVVILGYRTSSYNSGSGYVSSFNHSNLKVPFSPIIQPAPGYPWEYTKDGVGTGNYGYLTANSSGGTGVVPSWSNGNKTLSWYGKTVQTQLNAAASDSSWPPIIYYWFAIG